MITKKTYNLSLVFIGIIAVFICWYISYATKYLNGDSIYDKVFLHFICFFGSHYFLYYSFKKYKEYLKTNVYFYCTNLYIGRNNMKCEKQCERCLNLEKTSKQ